MQLITSISTVDKVYETGSNPLRIFGSDFNFYIAKFGKPKDLLNELIGAEFCSIWDIRVPPAALIGLLPEHIPAGLNKQHYSQLGFGSQYLEHALELTKILLTWKDDPYDLGRIVNKVDLLRIGLIDLWLANDDRNHNNANLLLQPAVDGVHLVAIDHVNLFNSGSLHRGLYSLSEESSILCSPYMPLFFRNTDKLIFAIDSLEKEFPALVAKCEQRLPTLLEAVPAEWGVNLATQEEQMKCLFSPKWTSETIKQFRLYIAQNFA